MSVLLPNIQWLTKELRDILKYGGKESKVYHQQHPYMVSGLLETQRGIGLKGFD